MIQLTAQELEQLAFHYTSPNHHIGLNLPADIRKLAHGIPLDNEIIFAEAREVVGCDLGVFSLLPPEMLELILDILDLESLTTMRAVNSIMRESINALPSYQSLYENAPNLLRAALVRGTARYFTCLDLLEPISLQTCHLCKNFGAFISVLSCKRYCVPCVSTVPLTCPLPLWKAKIAFALDKKTASSLPVLQLQWTPVDSKTAQRAGISLHGSKEAMDAQVFSNIMSSDCGRKEKFRIAERAGYTPPGEQPQPRTPYSTTSIDREHREWRFHHVILASEMHDRTSHCNLGVGCEACLRSTRGSLHDIPGYWTRDGLINHIEHCKIAQAMLAEIRAGTCKSRDQLMRLGPNMIKKADKYGYSQGMARDWES